MKYKPAFSIFPFLVLIFCSGFLYAECLQPEAPEFDRKITTSYSQMLATQNDVKEFIELASKNLECIKWDDRYNTMVDKMLFVGNRYNRFVREYRLKNKRFNLADVQ